MPAASVKSMRSHRRTTVEDAAMRSARQRELESKRARGEIACAECKRLKLKCDKKLPCSTCIRRDCISICPNGDECDQYPRSVHMDTDALYRKIAQMSERIRQLEESLEILQRASSCTPHPLLSEELLKIKFGIDVVTEISSPEHEDEARENEESELLNALGTLTISECGESHFLGSTGSSTTFLLSLSLTGEDEVSNVERLLHDLPFLGSKISETCPFATSSISKADLLLVIKSHFPPWERAWALCEAYMENVSWDFHTVDRAQVVEELFPAIYKRSGSGTWDVQPAGANPHELALILMVFALGAMFDLTLPHNNNEAELYRQLARAALGIQSVFTTPTLAAVQTMGLMGMYLLSSGRERTAEAGWLTMKLALDLAISVGLHRDPARWKMTPKLAERRRAVFWELYLMDNWQSLANGRPPTFALRFVDCKYPEYNKAVDNGQSILPDFWDWKYRYLRDVVSEVAHMMTSTTPLKYSDALKLDRKVRAFNFPIRTPSEAIALGNQGSMLDMQYFVISMYQDIVLQYIHRNFFAKALIDYPANPLLSPYAPSFLAAYRSSTQILKVMNIHFGRLPGLVSRIWPFWSRAFSAGVLVGSIVTRGPHSKLAPAALAELISAVNLFERAGEMVPMLKHSLPILIRLRGTALDAYSRYKSGCAVPASRGAHAEGDVTVKTETQDELSIIDIQTRFLSAKQRSLQEYISSGDSPQLSAEFFVDNKILIPTTLAMELDPAASDQYGDLLRYLSNIPASPISLARHSHSPPSQMVSWMEEITSSSPHLPPPSETYLENKPSQTTPSASSNPTFSAASDPINILSSLSNAEISGMDDAWMTFIQESGLLGSEALEKQI